MRERSLRAELYADTVRQLAMVRSAIKTARANGAMRYELGQMRAAIMRLEDDEMALRPRKTA